MSKTELKDGTLMISTVQGQRHVIYDIHSNLAGRIREDTTPETQVAGVGAGSPTRP
ncbi:MAG TPA: hypothetical protein VGE39_16040 [Prosthecobacter sp.]